MAAVQAPETSTERPPRPPIRFDRNEWAGAIGDLGTDLPLLVGMILATDLQPANVLTMFGVMQILTGVVYRLPMPVQPLKAIAAIVIAGKVSSSLIFGAGLALGICVLLLAVLGLLDWFGKVVPKCVVRGIQVGLGLQLANVALKEFVLVGAWTNYALAAVGAFVALALLGNRRLPAGLVLLVIGVLVGGVALTQSSDTVPFRFHLPTWQTPSASDIITGFLVLGLAQLPLSLANSLLATRQLIEDYFPDRRISLRKIGMTYGAMNVICPFFGGVPVCHGSGGMAGHYTFGGRTGGSVIVYGSAFLLVGLFFSDGFAALAHHFPPAILGVLLFFEGMALMLLVRDVAAQSPRRELPITILVALLASGVPGYGYLLGLGVGLALFYALRLGWRGWDRGE